MYRYRSLNQEKLLEMSKTGHNIGTSHAREHSASDTLCTTVRSCVFEETSQVGGQDRIGVWQ